MTDVEQQIQALVNLETTAWNGQDADCLVSLCHPDMVWPWPSSVNSLARYAKHNPDANPWAVIGHKKPAWLS